MFNFSWTNKKDGDDIYAEHVNSLADGIKETQEAVENISIDIDTEMSDTSTNAVQNKVVKTYIDESVGDVYSDVQTIESELELTSAGAQSAYQLANDAYRGLDDKSDKPSVLTYSYPSHEYEFNYMHNCDIRNGELTTLSFIFGNGEYAEDYASGLSFDSGATPTAIDYTDSGILNWVGTDCVTSDGLSIFQPSANTHYDIVFYFNGVQFIGLVNGYVPAGGNEAI